MSPVPASMTKPVPEAVSSSYVSVAVTSTTLGSILARMTAFDSGRYIACASCPAAFAASRGGEPDVNGRSSAMPPRPSATPSTATSSGITVRLRGRGSWGVTPRIFPAPLSAHTRRDQAQCRPLTSRGRLPPVCSVVQAVVSGSRGRQFPGRQPRKRGGRAGGVFGRRPDRVDGGSLLVEGRHVGLELGLRARPGRRDGVVEHGQHVRLDRGRVEGPADDVVVRGVQVERGE